MFLGSVQFLENLYDSGIVTVIASDGQLSTSATFNISVSPVNDAPIVFAIDVSTDEGSGILISLEVEDVDSDSFEIFIMDYPDGGTIGTIDNTALTIEYEPYTNFFGSDLIEYRVYDGVDYSNCRFSDGQDLKGSFLPNSNLSFASFIQVNFDKSIMMNSNLSFGTFPESTFVRANLYETITIGANFEKTDFTGSNLTRVDFMGATLIEANFQNANLIEADFSSANITNANFDGANLNNATWTDGNKCGQGSIGVCKK